MKWSDSACIIKVNKYCTSYIMSGTFHLNYLTKMHDATERLCLFLNPYIHS